MYISKCCLSHRFKDRNNMALLIDREKVFDKIYPLVLKVLERLGMEEAYVSILKAMYNKPIANIMLKK